MLKFIRTNFEIYLDHFKSERVSNLLIKQQMRRGELKLFQTDLKVGVVALNEHLFEIVSAFTQVVGALTRAIPTGMRAESDRSYGLERREDLLESTLLLFYKVNELLDCLHAPPDEESKEREKMAKPATNSIMETLFERTHSDKRFSICTPEVHDAIKTERKFAVLVNRTEPNQQALPIPLDEALNDIKFFHTPQADLE